MIIKSDQIDSLVERVNKDYTDKSKRYLISLAGVPGSGKTTFATLVAAKLNNAIVLSQDGYHLYRHELAELDDPQEAIRRRGAPFTFNVKRFAQLVSKLSDRTYITAPSFDHAVKDPIEDDIVIDESVDIIIIEGNYVSLKDDVWSLIESYMNDTWFLITDEQLVRTRIIQRHLVSGIAATKLEAEKRADGSDLQNAKYILENSKPTKVTIM